MYILIIKHTYKNNRKSQNFINQPLIYKLFSQKNLKIINKVKPNKKRKYKQNRKYNKLLIRSNRTNLNLNKNLFMLVIRSYCLLL